MCRLYSASFHFTTDPINPPIFRTFRSLWLLQNLWLALVCCGVAPPPKVCATVEFHLSPPALSYTRHSSTFGPSHVNLCVCLLSLIGPLFIPLVDHRQSNSTQSSCHLFSPAPILCFFHLLFSNFKFLPFY